MKIISQYKDYYDYLVGIYGEDPKLILDRRPTVKTDSRSDYVVEYVWVCGYEIVGMWLNGRFLCGNGLAPFALTKEEIPKSKYYIPKQEQEENYIIPILSNPPWNKYVRQLSFPKEIRLSTVDINLKENCPILSSGSVFPDRRCPKPKYSNPIHFPILRDYNLAHILPAEQLWLMLSEWLAKRIDAQQQHRDVRSDVEKLQSAGFDKKTSFRHPVKPQLK